MNLRNFSKEVSAITAYIHPEILKRKPSVFVKEKLTLTQLIILGILRAKKKCAMSELSRALRVTKSAVTGITDRLIRSGFLTRERSKEDRRVVWVRLTGKGVTLADKISSEQLEMISTLFSGISERERTQYLNILRKIQSNLKNTQAKGHDA